MILLAAKGWSNEAVARSLRTRREVVSLWRKHVFEDRLAGLEDHSRSWRPRAFSPEVVVTVKALAGELPARTQCPLAR